MEKITRASEKSFIFESSIISSAKYLSLKRVRYILYSIILILIWSIIRPRTMYKEYDSLAEIMGWDISFIFGLICVSIVVAFGLYYYSIQYPIFGNLCFSEKMIIINIGDEHHCYPYGEIEDLKIERGATYHYEYKKDNYLFEADNWISFLYHGKVHKCEFIIDSAKKNKQFEQLVHQLRTWKQKFVYKSI